MQNLIPLQAVYIAREYRTAIPLNRFTIDRIPTIHGPSTDPIVQTLIRAHREVILDKFGIDTTGQDFARDRDADEIFVTWRWWHLPTRILTGRFATQMFLTSYTPSDAHAVANGVKAIFQSVRTDTFMPIIHADESVAHVEPTPEYTHFTVIGWDPDRNELLAEEASDLNTLRKTLTPDWT